MQKTIKIILFSFLLFSCRAQKEMVIYDTIKVEIPVEVPSSEVEFSDSSIVGLFVGGSTRQENDTIKVVVYKDTITYKIKVKYKDVIKIDTFVVIDTIIDIRVKECEEVKHKKASLFDKIKLILILITIIIALVVVKALIK